ncbi:serine hydrolase domain-containing protein [Undibacterium sp. SXout11W]|uniref:serine hydrolase domain-containing protein n=1 Tax=Undibacterium sp. SXout11W TaxID=3413050 RepID=UPI003BF32758
MSQIPQHHFFLKSAIISLLSCGVVLNAPSAQAGASLSVEEDALAIKAQLVFQEECRRDEFSGAMLVAQGSNVIAEGVCGEASKRYHVPNKIDTKFNIASIGKMFTAVAIAQLAEAGKLTFDDKINKYIDSSWLPAKVTERITIGQLLAHSDGLTEFMTMERAHQSSRALYRELDDLKPMLQGIQPEFEPGTRYYYANTGYVLLGVIVQKLSGQNYYDYVRQHIYQVAGMNGTDSYALDEPVENLAMGYMRMPGGIRESTFEGVMRGFSFGCGYSTVRDLLHFTQALQDGRLIKPATLKTLWQNHSPEETQKHGGYGYGFELSNSKMGPVVGHSGGFPGVSGNVNIYTNSGYVVIALSNYWHAAPVAESIERVLSIRNISQ